MEYVKSDVEYFPPEPILTQIERSFYGEYTPISALQHQTPIEFVVHSTDQIYLDLSRSFIYVKGKITDAAGVDNAANVEIGPINNPIHAIFSNVDIELGGKSFQIQLASTPMSPTSRRSSAFRTKLKNPCCKPEFDRRTPQGNVKQGFVWSRWNEYSTYGTHGFLLEEC